MYRSKMARLFLGCAILISFVGCDQATKHIASQTLQNVPPKSFLGDSVRLEYALNPGGFLSLGGTLSPEIRFLIFVGFNLCVMVGTAICLCLSWKSRLTVFAPIALILAGGIGNLIDRITNQGLVTDFLNLGLNFGFGQVRTGIFNVADMCVMLGAAMLVFGFLRDPNMLDEVTGHVTSD